MPYPLIPLVAMAAGAGMQAAGARKARKEMNDTRNAEMQRQAGYQREANRTFDQSLEKSGRDVAANTMEQATQGRVAAYDRTARQGTGNPMVAARVNQTVSAPARNPVAASGTAWSKLVAGNQARLGSVGDWQLQQGIKDTRSNQALAITSNNARGSARLLPMELQDASHAGDELTGWGQLLSAAGQMAGSAGASGAGAGAGATKTGTFTGDVKAPGAKWDELLGGFVVPK